MENVASGGSAENSILVLQTHHVDVVEIQEGSRIPIRLDVILSQRPSNAIRIVVTLFRVVYRKRQQTSCSILRRDGRAQVGSKCGDAALSGKIVTDDRDPTGQRRPVGR